MALRENVADDGQLVGNMPPATPAGRDPGRMATVVPKA
jgi:hypothetical protein